MRGIGEARRLVLADAAISRTHLEIRLDVESDRAFVIDTSSNGTLLNGVRLERAVALRIRPGDDIRIGDVTLVFHSQQFTSVTEIAAGGTPLRISQAALVMVVGDIMNYSTISQVTDEAVMAHSLHTLWRRLGDVLRSHHGTLSHYAGDALFAVWELPRFRTPPNWRSTSRCRPIGWSRNWDPSCRCAARTARRYIWAGVWCRAWLPWPR